MNLRFGLALTATTLGVCAISEQCMSQPAYPTWTPVSMVTELIFPDPPGAGRATEPNPGGPFNFSLGTAFGYTVDTGCVYPSNPAIYINSTNESGKPIYRNAQDSVVSASNSTFKGIDVKAAFLSSGMFEEVAFFHENPCYITGREYGFDRNASANSMVFYVANNANCFPQNSGMTSCWNGSSWLTSIRNNYAMPNVSKNSQGNYEYYYAAFVYFDSAANKYAFYLTIQDPGTFNYIWHETFIPPSVPQSDVIALESGTGYVTTTLQSQVTTTNAGGNFQVYGVWIGR
jgi:hypothetical protein